MKKIKTETVFVCKECGYESIKWLGKCPECSSWGSFVEFKDSSAPKRGSSLTEFSSEVRSLKEIQKSSQNKRILTGISEFDRIMGGGIVVGSVVLLGGEPGIGKSTLMLQIADKILKRCILENKDIKVFYISGEESLDQIKLRADRLNIENKDIYIVSETCIERIKNILLNNLANIVILDSIQTLYSENIQATQGSILQVRNITQEIVRFAKMNNITVFILGQITKEGDIAGPKLLEHMVDTVLYFESETTQNYRILRVYKNRFGPTSEIGVFEMTAKGLKEVDNPSSIFIQDHDNLIGTATTCLIEGTRPILTQIQCLVSRSYFPQPRRVISGIDYNRAMLLISVLEKFCNIVLVSEDVYINVVSGLKIKETAVDLAVIASIYSAYKNKFIDNKNIYIGEVGLNGELRSVNFINERINEAIKLGYSRVFLPSMSEKNIPDILKDKIELVYMESLQEVNQESFFVSIDKFRKNK